MAERPPETLITRTLPRPREARPEAPHASLNRNDILIALFKHKKKIALAAAVGLLAAAAVYILYPPVYESKAKLLVRYLVERSTVDAIDNPTNSMGTGRDNVLGSEVEILSSWDLAVEAADAVGPKRLLPKATGVATKEAAAGTISSGLRVFTFPQSNIIFVSYSNGDPELATLVLNELVNRYFNKHLEVHRSAGAFDFVTQQTDQVRSRLNQTEDALKDLKDKAGIVSLAESTTALSNEAARTEEQLHMAESELAEQQARVRQMGGAIVETNGARKAIPVTDGDLQAKGGDAGGEKSGSANPEAPSEAVQQYQVLVSRLPQLRQAKLDLLAKYTPQNQMVRANQAEIDEVESQRRDLERKYPDLPARVAPIGSYKNQQLDPASETAHLAGLQAKKDALTARLRDVQGRIQQLAQLGPQIADLERQKQLEETNYKYFAATLEKARVDEALDPSKIPNISVVQRPSPPVLANKTRDKVALALAGGGIALGVALALLRGLVLNQTLGRPLQLETQLHIPLMLSIPYANGRFALPRNGSPVNATALSTRRRNPKLAPWESEHFIRPYCDAIRD